MSCWFGFPPPSRWVEYGLGLRVDLGGDNVPIPLNKPLQVAVAAADLVHANAAESARS